MAIHHKAPEQHYTTLMAHSGLPYDINPPPHSTDFICKVVGGDKLFFFAVFFSHRVANGRGVCAADISARTQKHKHAVYICAPPLTLVSGMRRYTHTNRDIKNRSADAHTLSPQSLPCSPSTCHYEESNYIK